MRKKEWLNGPVKLNQFCDNCGLLYPLEFNFLPFTPKRVFFVTNVNKGEERGKHAHYTTEQVLICIQGKILVRLVDQLEKKQEFILSEGEAIFVPKMIWDSQVFLTGKDVLLSLASTEYNRKDYIESYHEFINEKNRNNS